MRYASVEEGRLSSGLRLTVSRGVFGPWGIAARAILDVKGIPYELIGQDPGAANVPLVEWTGTHSAPVAMFEEERPRAHWSEILLLAERLSPLPTLIPSDARDRMLVFGICHEICGEDGFGWNARRLLFAIRQRDTGFVSRRMEHRYGDTRAPLDQSVGRLRATLLLLSEQLAAQQAHGSMYLVGTCLSAADLYWASFSNMLAPLPPQWTTPAVKASVASRLREECGFGVPRSLLEHRARVMRTAFKLPIAV